MIGEFFIQMSGNLVRSILNFYLKYQVIFNLIIFVYGIIIIIGNYNLKKITLMILKESGEDSFNKENINEILEKEINWNSIVSQIKIPIISSEKIFWIKALNKNNIIKVIKKRVMNKTINHI
jgi:hypothetical protein